MMEMLFLVLYLGLTHPPRDLRIHGIELYCH